MEHLNENKKLALVAFSAFSLTSCNFWFTPAEEPDEEEYLTVVSYSLLHTKSNYYIGENVSLTSVIEKQDFWNQF